MANKIKVNRFILIPRSKDDSDKIESLIKQGISKTNAKILISKLI